MSRGRPTDLVLQRRKKPPRMLSRLGTIDIRQRVPQQLAEMMSLLAELVEIYRSAGGRKIIVYVRRLDDDHDGDVPF